MRGMIRVVDIEQKAEELLNECERKIKTLEEQLKRISDKAEREDLWNSLNRIAQEEAGILELLNSLNFDANIYNGEWVVRYSEVDDGHDADYEEQKLDCQWL